MRSWEESYSEMPNDGVVDSLGKGCEEVKFIMDLSVYFVICFTLTGGILNFTSEHTNEKPMCVKLHQIICKARKSK